MSTDLAAIIEAAYAAGDDETWLERLLRATRPVLDAGLGVIGFFYDMSDVTAPRLRVPQAVGTPEGTREALDELLRQAPPPLVGRLYRLIPSCATMSDRLGLGAGVVDLPLHRALLAPLGIADFLAVAATSSSGEGCLIGAPLPAVTSMAMLDEATLTAVAAHVTAGMRMRRQSAGEESTAPIWAALAAGRWTVVDAFDREGSRFLLAKANGASKPLSAREHEIVARAAKGQSNKLIALELGLAPSTIAGHLAKASTKLGVQTRVELIRAFAGKR